MGIYLFIGILVVVFCAIKITVDKDWIDVVSIIDTSVEDLNHTIVGIFIAGIIIELVWPAFVIYCIYEYIKRKIES